MTSWPFGDLPMFGFDFVMADPPWHYELRSAAGEAKAPQAHYKTMPLPAIAAMPVGDLLAPGGAILLWCTWPLVATGAHVAVLQAWGYPPVTGGVWAKRTPRGRFRWGPGYVVRSLCEPWIIGRAPGAGLKGPGVPNMIETLADASLDGVAREHSRKPEEFYPLVEALTPGRRRLELFSRTDRPGWPSWGDEAGRWVAA